jgi:hypothetical protein
MDRTDKRATILLVEDNDDDVTMVRRTLQRSEAPAKLHVADAPSARPRSS